MSKDIINRVSDSKLKTIDLEDFYPPGQRVVLDISIWLRGGIVLHEKEFRAHLDHVPWADYQDAYVALCCSSDAIIPAWAYMLVATKLNAFAKTVVIGSLEALETQLFTQILSSFDVSPYKDKPVIIKGCADKAIPPNAYLLLINKLQTHVKSLMYGEACSSVPLYKKPRLS
ncbi:MAG: DUF2480 family protein [Flavobacteriaceae bacterium]|nr:DUF2480 family protein [Flavobacteriaceae bacterium]